MTIPVLTNDEIRGLITHPSVGLVDLRSVNAYNGWAIGGERRDGHIPDAHSLLATLDVLH